VAIARKLLPGAISELAEIVYNLPAFLRLRHALKSIRPDFVYERYNLYYCGGMLLKWCYGVPLYLEINSPLAAERARFGGLGLRRLAQLFERLVWRSADKIFVVTGVLGDVVAGAGIVRERIKIIPNGVDRNAFPRLAYRAKRPHWVTVGFVGFVREWHGVDVIISELAAKRTQLPIRLVIVGPGCSALKSKVRALGVEQYVEFLGLIEREKIPEAIRAFDIALQPRAVSYASPLKLFEYMACSRAIVAPDQPNIREILKDGETAILFEPEKSAALWRAIELLARDPQLRERIGNAAREELDARGYTWQGNAARIIETVSHDLVRRGGSANAAPPLDHSVPRGLQ